MRLVLTNIGSKDDGQYGWVTLGAAHNVTARMHTIVDSSARKYWASIGGRGFRGIDVQGTATQERLCVRTWRIRISEVSVVRSETIQIVFTSDVYLHKYSAWEKDRPHTTNDLPMMYFNYTINKSGLYSSLHLT